MQQVSWGKTFKPESRIGAAKHHMFQSTQRELSNDFNGKVGYFQSGQDRPIARGTILRLGCQSQCCTMHLYWSALRLLASSARYGASRWQLKHAFMVNE